MTGQAAPVRLSVCIPTYRRAAMLDALLGDLAAQARPPQQIVIVDNDAAGSAAGIVEGWRARLPGIDLAYAIEPEQNISLARNRAVALADGEWLAFIDDDERAPPQWLAELEAAMLGFRPDGILAPVLPVLPPHAPAWLRHGGFYNEYHAATGSAVPINWLRLGNAMVSAGRLRQLDPVFDPAFGLTGGGDTEALQRMANGGAHFIWCEEAAVSEPVSETRMRLGWILMRAMRGGQDFARQFRAGRLGSRPGPARSVLFFVRAAAQMAAAAGLALVTWPAGRHLAARWLTRVAANFGKLLVLTGWQYREYARRNMALPPAAGAGQGHGDRARPASPGGG